MSKTTFWIKIVEANVKFDDLVKSVDERIFFKKVTWQIGAMNYIQLLEL